MVRPLTLSFHLHPVIISDSIEQKRRIPNVSHSYNFSCEIATLTMAMSRL